MVNRSVVGAHYGLRDWLAQRVTAAVMAVYTLVLAFALLLGPALSRDTWRTLMSGGLMRFASFLFIVCLCYHAWVGVRDIWMDYIKPTGVRLTLHVLTLLVLVGCAGWATQILWRLS
jgi:succinate dehydrogenase / fumarate reductase membrane anchor subunit